MTRNEEDDKGRPKSTNESMRLNPFADLLTHVELEQQANCSRFQLMQVREVVCLMEFTILQNYYMIRLFSEQKLWWFLLFSCTNSYYEDNSNDDFNDDLNDE